MSAVRLSVWLAAHPLSASEIDCCTTVMLKIIDGKCRMGEAEKQAIAALYDALDGIRARGEVPTLFDAGVHRLIAAARVAADEVLREAVYERRVLAESALSRPVMKAFKAMLRDRGLYLSADAEGDAPG